MGDSTIRHKVKILFDNKKSIEYAAKEYDLSFRRVADYYEDFKEGARLLKKVNISKIDYIKEIETLLFRLLKKEAKGTATFCEKQKSKSLEKEYVIYNAI